MAKRVLLAGIVGGIVLFLWGGLYHDALPAGFIGIKEIPQEQAVVNAVKTNVPEPGLYLFPGSGLPADAPFSQKKAAMQQVMQKPALARGIIIYQGTGSSAITPRQLVTECATNVLQALIVAFLLAQTGLRRYSSRLGFVFTLGILAAITTNISYWNWYGFPTNFTLNAMFFLLAGYFIVGAITAAIVKSSASKSMAASGV